MNITLTQAIKHKSRARREWQNAPFDVKIAALIRMQEMAQEMAGVSGRRFEGAVWKPNASHETGR